MAEEKKFPLEVAMLGRFSVRSDRGVFDDSDNRSLKMWGIMAYMIIHRDRLVSREELIRTFWTGEKSGNPSNALKTLIFRAREALEPVFGPELEPFLARRGSYQWNPAIECHLDTEEFRAVCKLARGRGQKAERRMALYEQIMERYLGDFLPRLKRGGWVDEFRDEYHKLYLEAVGGYAVLLDEAGKYEQMQALCQLCVERDPLDEPANILLMKALLRQGMNQNALECYSRCTDRRYRELGAGPSQEMQDLYTELMRMEKGLELDLGAIQRDLQETEDRAGAFYCEYGLFREIYRLEARRVERSGKPVFIGLITLSNQDGTTPDNKTLTAAMAKLKTVTEQNLRRGDVVARYSVAQLVFLLPGADRETSCMALERVAAIFQRQNWRTNLRLTYRTRAIERH